MDFLLSVNRGWDELGTSMDAGMMADELLICKVRRWLHEGVEDPIRHLV